jgi:hypothetical protein
MTCRRDNSLPKRFLRDHTSLGWTIPIDRLNAIADELSVCCHWWKSVSLLMQCSQRPANICFCIVTFYVRAILKTRQLLLDNNGTERSTHHKATKQPDSHGLPALILTFDGPDSFT